MECLRIKANRKLWSLTPEARQKIYDRKKSPEAKAYGKKYYRRNVQLRAKQRKAWTEANPNYFREHYAKNKERLKRKSSEWYHANAERAGQRQKDYVARMMVEDPEHQRALGRKHTATRRAIHRRVFIESIDPNVVFDRDKGRCGICKKRVDPKSKWEVDHIIPISKGGSHSYDNVQLAHRICNRSKSDKIPIGQPTLFQVGVSGVVPA